MADNSVTVVGNITRDPELRYTPTGQHTTPVRAVWSTLGFQTDSGLPPL